MSTFWHIKLKTRSDSKKLPQTLKINIPNKQQDIKYDLGKYNMKLLIQFVKEWRNITTTLYSAPY